MKTILAAREAHCKPTLSEEEIAGPPCTAGKLRTAEVWGHRSLRLQCAWCPLMLWDAAAL